MNQTKIKSIAAAFALALSGLSLNAPAETFDPEAENQVGSFTAKSSQSSCTYHGHVIRVSAYPEHDRSVVYWRKSSLENQYSYAETNDSRLLNAAMHAMNGPMQVSIRTDGSCTSHGDKGRINRIQLNP